MSTQKNPKNSDSLSGWGGWKESIQWFFQPLITIGHIMTLPLGRRSGDLKIRKTSGEIFALYTMWSLWILTILFIIYINFVD